MITDSVSLRSLKVLRIDATSCSVGSSCSEFFVGACRCKDLIRDPIRFVFMFQHRPESLWICFKAVIN